MRLLIFQTICLIAGALLIEGRLDGTQFFKDFSEMWRFFIDAVCFPVTSMAAGLLLDRLAGKGSIGLTTGHFEFRWFARVEAQATEAEAFPKNDRN